MSSVNRECPTSYESDCWMSLNNEQDPVLKTQDTRIFLIGNRSLPPIVSEIADIVLYRNKTIAIGNTPPPKVLCFRFVPTPTVVTFLSLLRIDLSCSENIYFLSLYTIYTVTESSYYLVKVMCEPYLCFFTKFPGKVTEWLVISPLRYFRFTLRHKISQKKKKPPS